MVLAVAHPWASASSYLSSQSVADSRCNPHATPRSSYSRRSRSCRFFLCRAALLCLVLQRHRRLSVPKVAPWTLRFFSLQAVLLFKLKGPLNARGGGGGGAGD